MGLALDTVSATVSAPGASFTGATPASGSGDSLTVRQFPAANQAFITGVVRRHGTAGAIRVISPLVHDNVTGLTYYTSETPSLHELPPVVGQPVQPGDTITVQMTGATTGNASAYLFIWYQNALGVSSQLYNWGDISGLIKNIKPFTVAVTASGTIGQWSDTLFTATENQLHATSYYAILGMTCDTALGVMGVKGNFTGNLRVCMPAANTPEDTSYWFVDQANRHGLPFIPVFSGQDRTACYVSVQDNAASTTSNITVICAELTNFTPHP